MSESQNLLGTSGMTVSSSAKGLRKNSKTLVKRADGKDVLQEAKEFLEDSDH